MKTIVDKIEKLINDEFNKKLERISKEHGIPIELLKEEKKENEEEQICKGYMASGKKCWAKCQPNGYCKRHVDQYEKNKPRMPIKSSGHNHPLHIPFSKDCPDCQEKIKKNEHKTNNLLI